MRRRVLAIAAAIALALAAVPARADEPLVATREPSPFPAGDEAPPPTRIAQDIDQLARSSVDARFAADPRDASRDLLTGRTRDELEQGARDYYRGLMQRDPESFERMRRRVLGQATAGDLEAAAMSELAEGRPASAELAWARLVDEHPDSPEAAPALLKLASSKLAAGDRVAAADDLARLPEMDLELSYQAAPLMARLLEEIEQELKRRTPPPQGSDRVVLHESLQSRDLDRVRDLSEWTAGYALLDDVARTLRLETSGDVLRVVKQAGTDAVTLDALVALVPLDERKASVRTEERLKGPTDTKGADERAAARSAGKRLERFENLSHLQQLQVLLLARTLGDLEIEPDAQRLGDRTLAERRGLAERLHELAESRADRTGALQRTPEDRAVGELVLLSDWNGDRRLTPLRDDEGLWRPKRFAVENDMRNAVTKPLDDDNARGVADLFEQTGLTEQALFASLVRATSEEGPADGVRVSPERCARLMAELKERSAPVWASAPHPSRGPRPYDAERDYLARLSVLRLPGEALEDVIARELLDHPSRSGPAAMAGDPRAARLVAELASLGERWHGAWLYQDDPPTAPRPMTASAKLERAQAIRAELDGMAAGLALDDIARALAADLESQGLRFSPEQLASLRQTIDHEDLGSLALVFDSLGSFSKVDHAVAMTQPGAFGAAGGTVAYGFGLDLMSGAPAASAGWQRTKELRDGGASLTYHVGAVGTPDGPADAAGVSARFRRKSVWQPEAGADASALRGLAGRGFFNLIRDVTLKHERERERIFAEHEAAKQQGRAAFLESLRRDDAPARPAVLFTRSLGRSDDAVDHDDASYRVLTDSYQFEKARQRSLLDRTAHPVRFAGVGFSAAFLAGDVYLLAGPMLALKDFRLFSRLVDSPSLRVQAEEAELRRVSVATRPRGGTVRRQEVAVSLSREPDSAGALRFVPELESERVAEETRPDPGEPQVTPVRFASATADEGTGDAPVAVLASTSPRVPGGAQDARAADDSRSSRGLARVTRAMHLRGIPLRLEPGTEPGTVLFVPTGLAPWCAQSLEIYAAEEQGLGVSIDSSGRPLLVAPADLDGVVVDSMQERRSVTRPGEADEVWRIAISLAPGSSASAIIEASARMLRCEIVNGRLVGAAVIATRHRTPGGEPRRQANVVSPNDADAAERIASLREDAARRTAPLPELPRVSLRPKERDDDGTIADPAALEPGFLDSLRRAERAQVIAFKSRSIRHAQQAGGRGLDPGNVSFIQQHSMEAHGRELSGEALDRAYFVLTHEGLYRGDRGTVAEQAQVMERRAVLPMDASREIGAAADPATRRIIASAGIDEPAALGVLHDRMLDVVARAKATGRLDTGTIEPGTRIVTASWSEGERGVQWATATEALPAHLIAPLSVETNEGRYVLAMGLGPDVPALASAIADEIGGGETAAHGLEPVLEQGIAREIASAKDGRPLRIDLAGATLTLTLANAPRAGALARCKNATLFPPAYGAMLERHVEQAITAVPAMWLGSAEAASRFAGDTWAGWRRMSLLAGGPLLSGGDRSAEPGGDDDDDTPPPPPREGVTPPPRAGLRGRPGDAPDRVKPAEPAQPEPPRDGDNPPGRGGTRGRPPDAPGREAKPGEPEPPRDGTAPPGHPSRQRPQPPDPSKRPRRPVD